MQPSLNKVEVAYVDSIGVLNAAYAAGLRNGKEIRTTSPALLRQAEFETVAADARLQDGSMQELAVFALELSHRLATAATKVPALEPHAAEIGRCITFAEQILLCAHCLEEADLDRPVAVLASTSSNAMVPGSGMDVWARLLAENPRLTHMALEPILDADAMAQQSAAGSKGGEVSGFLRRVRASDPLHISYRLMQLFWSALPMRSRKRPVLIASEKGENEIIKETALHLALAGAPLWRLPVPPNGYIEPPTEFQESIHDALEPVLSDALASRLAPRISTAAVAAIIELIIEWQGRFLHCLAWWEDNLVAPLAAKPRALLAGKVLSPQGRALAWVARRRNIPVITAQHGVTREISKLGDRYLAGYETTETDLHLAYNSRYTDLTNAGPFNRGKAVTVGMDRMQRQSAVRPNSGAGKPIWYISTTLYMARRLGLQRGMTDLEMCEYEIDLIENVFADCAREIVYKPYPMNPYEDADPVCDVARRNSLQVYTEALDMRFLFDQAGMIVTSRATSTLGWCLGSGIPVVFIDVPAQPLLPDVRRAMEQAVFVVDGGSPDAHSTIRQLLAKPMHELEAEYADKAQARASAIREFFDAGGDAGRSAARLIRSRAAQSATTQAL